MGLAAASLGEEARVDLVEAGLTTPDATAYRAQGRSDARAILSSPTPYALCRAGGARIEDRSAVAAPGGVAC